MNVLETEFPDISTFPLPLRFRPGFRVIVNSDGHHLLWREPAPGLRSAEVREEYGGDCCERLHSLPRLDPILVQPHVLDGLAFWHKKTVADVNEPILGLNHRRIVELAVYLVGWIAFQVALPLPGCAFVVRQGSQQRITARLDIVVDHHPISAGEADSF